MGGLRLDEDDPLQEDDGGLLLGPVTVRDSLTFRLPQVMAAIREHADHLPAEAGAILEMASARWFRLTGERLIASTSVVPHATAVSLWAAGFQPGEVPEVRPGHEGPLLRRNPLVMGLLYLLEQGYYAEAQSPDEFAHRAVDRELSRLQELEPPPPRPRGDEGEGMGPAQRMMGA